MSQPRVTVLMPVFNVEKHLRAAVDSVLSQTFSDFEFLIIDDCSTDGTAGILAAYDDPRIVLARNPQNLGIVASLNRGIARARGEYIARMDGDDICLPERLTAQVAYMDANPVVVLLGTKYTHIDDDGQFVYHGGEMPPPPEPGTPGYMRWSLLWMTSVQHPTAMIRRSALADMQYDAAYFTAEDYDLWARLSHRGQVARLQQIHLHYRVNPAGISTTRRQQQLDTHYRIMHRELCALMDAPLSEADTRVLFQMVVPQQPKGAPQEVIPGADLVAALRTYWAIRRRCFAVFQLQAEERAHIDREADRVLRRMLAYARAYSDGRERLALRAWLMRHAPGLFVRLAGEFIRSKQRRPTGT
ncbi:MAG: glycosyltransferase family 2 protein [Anaerolineae bacterium]|nr:glycosyltransferase family 2 protein [Anaerolineae bacterium]